MSKRVGKYKVSKKESELSLADGGVIKGGLSGGITGQIVHIIKSVATNNLVLENSEGDAQDFLLGGDLTFTGKPGGISCIFDGTNWIPLAHTALS